MAAGEGRGSRKSLRVLFVKRIEMIWEMSGSSFRHASVEFLFCLFLCWFWGGCVDFEDGDAPFADFKTASELERMSAGRMRNEFEDFQAD